MWIRDGKNLGPGSGMKKSRIRDIHPGSATLFWPNFIISMCGIKFWKDNKNLRSVYNKPFFEILSGFFHFWPFKKSSSKRFIVPSKRWKLFSLNRSNGASKNSSFRIDFKNVHMTLVKSAPKKILAKKLFYHFKIVLSPKKIGFLAKSFSSHRRVSVYFLWLKGPKWRQPLNISENGFLQTSLRISSAF